MNNLSFPCPPSHPLRRLLAALLLAVTASGAIAATPPALLDDFAAAEHSSTGAPRLLITDRDLGSHSQAEQSCADGILRVHGELVPGRGVPAFISVPLMLSPEGQPVALTGYTGVRLRVKLLKGILAVQVSSTEVDNFDYHTSTPIAGGRGEFQEVRIPFAELKRAWSEPTPLNLGTITSVNLVAFGMDRTPFSYEVDEVGFY